MEKECTVCGDLYNEDDMYEDVCENCVSPSVITAERETIKADQHQDNI